MFDVASCEIREQIVEHLEVLILKSCGKENTVILAVDHAVSWAPTVRCLIA